MGSNLIIMVSIIGVMGLVGLFFGFVLAIANKKLKVEQNPLIDEVSEILPKGQCGACGFAGCQAYAEAVVMNPDVAPNLCVPGKEAVARKVSELTGKKSEKIEERLAFVKCSKPLDKTSMKYEYSGIEDCVAMSLLQLGPKNCQYGCIGHGTCVKQCPFGAITMGDNGLPVVNQERCTGCGKCEDVCPKKVIELIPVNTKVNVACNSRRRGAQAKKECELACLGCSLCAKLCPHDAVKMVNNLPVIDKHICMEICSDAVCVTKCPTKAIRGFR